MHPSLRSVLVLLAVGGSMAGSAPVQAAPAQASTAAAGQFSPERQATHVLNRLGYGPRPGDIERVMRMGVERYIESQLNPASQPLPESLTRELDALAITHESAGQTLAIFLAVRNMVKNEDAGAVQRRRETIARIGAETAQARLLMATQSPRQLEEVMVDFWFNHFNVYAGKGLDRALIESYERDAIRPYALGNFRALLGATAKHPAMLFYLDNWLSSDAPQGVAPGFRTAAGAKAKATGLNENYARELMELHTLGVDGGYTQNDVTELARMLAGWSFAPRLLARNDQGFHFDAARHGSEDKLWLGQRIQAQGQQEGERALDILAMHPATAHHLSYELAQYFVQDVPPPALVERMAQRYLQTGGDIRAVLHTLFFSAEFMSPSAVGAKFKTPYQFVLSAVRAADLPLVNVRPLAGTLNQLGMPLYGCQTPDGYKNTEDAWLNPDALTRRITFATALATGRLRLAQAAPPLPMTAALVRPAMDVTPAEAPAQHPDPSVDPSALLQTLGPGISSSTVAAVDASPQALRAALILGSPDFMRH